MDELFAYYEQVVFIQEKQGLIKEGTFDKITEQDNAVSSLRKQLFKINTKK